MFWWEEMSKDKRAEKTREFFMEYNSILSTEKSIRSQILKQECWTISVFTFSIFNYQTITLYSRPYKYPRIGWYFRVKVPALSNTGTFLYLGLKLYLFLDYFDMIYTFIITTHNWALSLLNHEAFSYTSALSPLIQMIYLNFLNLQCVILSAIPYIRNPCS